MSVVAQGVVMTEPLDSGSIMPSDARQPRCLVADSRDFGIAGVDLTPGDHLCALYFGEEERDAIVLPYLRAGLRDGDKCICIIDSSPVGDILARIGARREVEGYVASRQLEMYTTNETYLSAPPFNAQAMLDYWENAVGATVRAGQYGFARVSGEVPPEMRFLPDRAEFFRYEAGLNRFAPRYPQVMICLYDLQRLGGGLIVDLLRTHPKLLMGGLILENPHYRAPDDFAAPQA
jgi:hypothetical protein